jgi:hypothetical protein
MFEQNNVKQVLKYVDNLEDKLKTEAKNRRATIKKLSRVYSEAQGVFSFA